MTRKFLLQHSRAPGDHVVLTALVRDLKAAYPDCEVGIDSRYPDIWANNPHLSPLKGQTGVQPLKMDYGRGIREQKTETIHFLACFHRDFQAKAKLHVPLTLPYPDLHLTEAERNARIVDEPYWLFLSGGKRDVTVKIWDPAYWQETIDRLRRHGLRFVQVGENEHMHPAIDGVLNLVGQTSLRELMRLVAQAEGVICGVTAAMHMAAAFHKPCVVIAGGREAWHFEAYVRENRGLGPAASLLKMPHRYLHTTGLLECSVPGGCWKNKTIPISEDKLLCKLPVIKPGSAVPKCLDIITPALVETAVLSYFLDGSLPPQQLCRLS